MKEKEAFISAIKLRTKKLAIDVIKFCETLKTSKASAVITYQIVKSATSVGANYRAACRARSRAEFFSKICIVVEEADETEYWLEIIRDSKLSPNQEQLQYLLKESNEITRIVTKAKTNSHKSKRT